MHLSLKIALLAALFSGSAQAGPGGRFGAVVDAAAEGCLGPAAATAASPALKACAASLRDVIALGARLSPEAAGSPEAAHIFARRAAIELRLSALQAVIEGAAHSDVCHWARASAASAAAVVISPGDARAEAAYRSGLEASAAAASGC